MKIVFVIPYLSDYGGTVRVANELANGLVERGYDISIISRDDKTTAYFLSPNVSDVRIQGNFVAFLKGIKAFYQQNQPDIVIVHTMSKLTPLILSALSIKKLWSIEHIAFDFHQLPYRLYRQWFYRRLEKVIVLTEHEKRIFQQINLQTVRIANPSPFAIRHTAYPQDSKTIISIGRLTWQKGYDLLLLAWQQVQPNFPDWQLHIYGEGEEKQALQAQIQTLNLTNIILKGIHKNTLEVYDNASFYVMSSRFEGLPMVLIEAQTRGLPIVSFDCPSGPAEIISDKLDGLLVKNGDITALADAMMTMIQNDNDRLAMSKQAIQSAKRYQIDNVINQWVDLIENG